jgi:hypothetical protein
MQGAFLRVGKEEMIFFVVVVLVNFKPMILVRYNNMGSNPVRKILLSCTPSNTLNFVVCYSFLFSNSSATPLTRV